MNMTFAFMELESERPADRRFRNCIASRLNRARRTTREALQEQFAAVKVAKEGATKDMLE